MTCKECNGRGGFVDALDFRSFWQTCHVCAGSGTVKESQMNAVEVIHVHQLNDQGNGNFTVSIVNPVGIMCQNPDRPAEAGDVYSCNSIGEIIARPAGTAFAGELVRVVGGSVVFAPLGPRGIAVMMPYVSEIPNA